MLQLSTFVQPPVRFSVSLPCPAAPRPHTMAQAQFNGYRRRRINAAAPNASNASVPGSGAPASIGTPASVS